ncbi:hypothetical protein M378DRAFT_629165 [Amanita muscaria Koide BX008]|uniref:Uncharacterized protein n=1 Tax=Amanita muscaria (strain Koide BX008) TaxID=946122 RepID=A0A0C2WRC8_AMAMK|nr:hypothetical protein M378DRAFT_629165 [Amanita muscaria Koide BX008]
MQHSRLPVDARPHHRKCRKPDPQVRIPHRRVYDKSSIQWAAPCSGTGRQGKSLCQHRHRFCVVDTRLGYSVTSRSIPGERHARAISAMCSEDAVIIVVRLGQHKPVHLLIFCDNI